MQTAYNDFILYFYAFRQQAFSCNAWLTLVRATQKANSHRNEYFSPLNNTKPTIFAHKKNKKRKKFLMLKKNGKQEIFIAS